MPAKHGERGIGPEVDLVDLARAKKNVKMLFTSNLGESNKQLYQ